MADAIRESVKALTEVPAMLGWSAAAVVGGVAAYAMVWKLIDTWGKRGRKAKEE